ncbi:FAD-binding protein [Pseudonocardia sp. NPDC046786]|uniref:FAD-binding protein n=1 Tax=Pseudonocardia sp. NPDC046786 TaxID=3155471 RepID=UPI0034019657
MNQQDTIRADVLVVGGGPAGTWAALTAAATGASVVLADKGHCGSSGATAAAGTGIWYVDPDPQARAAAKASREALGGHLADHRWMDRVLDRTWELVDDLSLRGRYPFPRDPAGREVRTGVQGPEYMRRMRIRVQRAGVRILDHAPVTELLADRSGTVAGAAGIRLRGGDGYRVQAGAVVLAAGGCAFRSGTLGCHPNTGDGALLAVEAGAELSGMEFSNAYAIAPEGTSLTKTAYYAFATFLHADGSVLDGAGGARGRSVIARALADGERVYCVLDRADDDVRAAMRLGQPNFFLPFDRLGIDPFTEPFPVTLLLEGTVRGTGGVHVTGDDCATAVPGLYVAGDTATRELICGGFTGGGSHNAAWAMSSGSWAGEGAAAFATSRPAHRWGLRPLGGAGLRPAAGPAGPGAPGADEVVTAVQRQVLPYDINLFRTGAGLTAALAELDIVWAAVRTGLRPASAAARDVLRAREAAAMTAHARWMYTAALARTESRGMHRRSDFPATDPAQHRRLRVRGIDTIAVSPDRVRQAVGA